MDPENVITVDTGVRHQTCKSLGLGIVSGAPAPPSEPSAPGARRGIFCRSNYILAHKNYKNRLLGGTGHQSEIT